MEAIRFSQSKGVKKKTQKVFALRKVKVALPAPVVKIYVLAAAIIACHEWRGFVDLNFAIVDIADDITAIRRRRA